MRESCAFLCGKREIRFGFCRSVEKYTANEICLVLSDLRVCIVGAKLQITTYRNGEISVTGSIENIALAEKEGRK